MKWRLASALTALIGAFVGGVYPGSFFAFVFTAAMQLPGRVAEGFWFVLTTAFGGGGAGLGLILFSVAFPDRLKRLDIIVGLLLGLLVGVTGYFFCYWVIANADPPL